MSTHPEEREDTSGPECNDSHLGHASRLVDADRRLRIMEGAWEAALLEATRQKERADRYESALKKCAAIARRALAATPTPIEP